MSLRAKELLLKAGTILVILRKAFLVLELAPKNLAPDLHRGDTAFVWNSSAFLCEASNAEMCPKEQWQPSLGTATLNLV